MQTVLVLEADRELRGGLTPQRATLATAASNAEVVNVAAGAWEPPERDPGGYGLLVLDGLLLRRVGLGGRSAVELVGAGDVLRPWPAPRGRERVSGGVSWRAHTPVSLAVLDARFAARTAPFPEIAAHIVRRMARRSDWLALQMAIVGLPRLQQRLHVALWSLADRWGRVTRDGVVVPLPLTHELIGQVVGARRPAVTTALGHLHAHGLVARRADGGWLLRGAPPHELAELQEALPA